MVFKIFRKSKLLNPHNVGYKDSFQFFAKRRHQYIRSTSVLSKFVKPEDDFIDVGSNVGFFSLEYMKRISFNGHAHLFEPVPNLARLCGMSFKDLPYKVTVHPFGLGDADTVSTIYTADDGNIGWNTLVMAKASPGMQKMEIRTRRFDSLGIGLERVGAIKIDVEGGEYLVLAGMLPLLKMSNRLPAFLIEIGWGKNHPNWEEELDAFTQLEELGYGTFDLNGTRLDVADLNETKDVLFVPESLSALCKIL